MSLSAKRLLGGMGKSSLDSCRLLGIKKKKCRKVKKKARKIKRQLMKRPKRL